MPSQRPSPRRGTPGRCSSTPCASPTSTLVFINRAADSRRPLQFSLEELTLGELRLEGQDLTVGDVSFRSPRLRVLRDIDPAFLAAQAEADEAAAEAVALAAEEELEITEPLAVRMREISVDDARFTIVTADGEVEVSLSVSARELGLEQGRRFPLELRVELADGFLQVEGEAGVVPVAFDGNVTWAQLPLPLIADAADVGIDIDSGTASGELDVDVMLADVATQGPSRIDVAGRVGVESLALSQGNAATVQWKSFEVVADMIHVRPDPIDGEQIPTEVQLASVRLIEPIVSYTVQPVAASPPAEEAPATEASESDAVPAPMLRVGELEVRSASADFRDPTVTPAHRSRIRSLDVEGTDLRWPEGDARSFKLRGKGPTRNASFALQSRLSRGDGRVKLTLDELRLAAFSPYVAEAAGYWIEDGTASVDADVMLNGNDVGVKSDVNLNRLGVTEVTPGSFDREFGIPLGVALALLRDPNGNISLPVNADVRGGETSAAIRPLVVAGLRQAITGALTSPLKGVGMVMGGKQGKRGLEIEPVAFTPGQVEADPAELERVLELAKVLEVRPGLALVLRGRSDPSDDPALAQRILAERVVAKQELPSVDAGFFQKRRLRGALEKQTRGETVDLNDEDTEALERWASEVSVPDERREALGRERAEAVRAALVAAGANAADVVVHDSVAGPPGVLVGLAPAKR